jgi:hypothetical protein
MGMRIMMLQMSFNCCPKITVREIPEYGYALMYIYIVEHKISKSVEENADSETQHITVGIYYPKIDKQYAWYGKDHRKNVVPLNFSAIAHMMVFVKYPQKSVHYVFMGKPGHKFHEEEGQNYK